MLEPQQEFFEKLLAEKHVPGMSIAKARSGEIEIEAEYGYSNLELQVPMARNSVHKLASVSKQFTAAAILKLTGQGTIKLDQKINDFLKKRVAAWDSITVLHLLHHTSGLPDYLDAIPDMAAEITYAQILFSLSNEELRFEPGQKFEYSNTGYLILGHLVERLTGKSLGECISQEICVPLGLSTIVPNDPEAIVSGRVNGYSLLHARSNPTLVNAAYNSPVLSTSGDGGMMASAIDLVNWNNLLYGGAVLAEPELSVMTTPSPQSLSTKGSGTWGYGAGLGITKTGKETLFSHAGEWNGTSTFLSFDQNSKTSIVVLANRDGLPLEPGVHFLNRLS